VEQLLEPLRLAEEQSKKIKPTFEKISDVINLSGMISIFNLLPEPFRDQQSEAVSLIRDIAITAFNQHNDPDLSWEILNLSLKFNFKSTALTQRLAEDLEQIENLIEQERQHETKLTQGDNKLEVTKDGVRQGSTFIKAENVISIRWGVAITGTQYVQIYNFLMVCRDNIGTETKFSWQSSTNVEDQHELFRSLVNAALNYIVPKIYEKIQERLLAGSQVKIGPCSLLKNSLSFVKTGWFNPKLITIPWCRVETNINNGVISVYDSQNPKTRVEMEIREIENAAILPLIASILKQS
jgi:hypothetical protein